MTASETDLQNGVDLIWTFLTAQTITTEHNTLLQATTSDFQPQISTAAERFRQAVDAVIEVGQELFDLLLISLAHHDATSPARDIDTVLRDIYDYWHANSKSIEERAFTFGAISMGGGNTGDGTIRILTVDWQDYNLQAVTAELKTWTVIKDVNLGAQRHKPEWRVEGTNQGPTLYLQQGSADNQGSGLRLEPILGFADSDSLVLNPSFDVVSVAAGQPTTGADAALASGDTVQDWTADDVTKLTSTVDDFYRKDPATGTNLHKALILEGNVLLTQDWAEKGISVQKGVPYWCQLGVKRMSSADGTLTVRVGALSFNVDVTTLTNGVWTLLVPSNPTTNHLLWGENLTESDATFEVQLALNTTGTVRIDGFGVWPMELVDGLYYAPVSGATDHLDGDSGTNDVTLTAEGKVQAVMRLYHGDGLPPDSVPHFPHAAVPTIADP